MADITLTEDLDLSDSETHELANEVRELARLTETVSFTGHYHPTIVEAPVTASEVVEGIRSKAMTATESVGLTSTVLLSRATAIREAPTLTDTVVTRATRVIEVIDGAGIADESVPLYTVVAHDSVALTNTVTTGRDLFAHDSVAASDTVTPSRSSTAIVVDSVAASDTSGAPRVAMGVESVALTDTVAATRRSTATVAESATAATVVGASRRTTATAIDSAAAHELVSTRRDSIVTVADTVEATDGVGLPTATIPALFVNLQTGAAALWDGLPLNSLVEVDGVLYGASQDGLHTLGSDDDDGTPIEAEILWDLDDMGVRQRKRLKSVYVVAQSAGPFNVRVINEQGTFDYPTKLPRTAKATNHRAVPGRGLDSAFFRIGLLFTEPGAVDHLIVEAEATVRSL